MAGIFQNDSTSPSDTMLQDKDASHAGAQSRHPSAHSQGGDLWPVCQCRLGAIKMRKFVLKAPKKILVVHGSSVPDILLEKQYSFQSGIYLARMPNVQFLPCMKPQQPSMLPHLIAKASCIAQNLGLTGLNGRFLAPLA